MSQVSAVIYFFARSQPVNMFNGLTGLSSLDVNYAANAVLCGTFDAANNAGGHWATIQPYRAAIE